MNDPKYKNIDLVEQFYKENVDLKAIQKARAAKKPVTSGLEPYTGKFGKAQKKHLLNRTMMGYAHRHYKDIENLTLDQAIDLIFTPEEKPEPPVNDYYHEVSKEGIEKGGHTYVLPGEYYHETPEIFNGSPWRRYESFRAWLFKNNITQKTSIHWRIVFFFRTILSTGDGSVKEQYQHMNMLFDNVFKSYKNTIRSLTLDPMMLSYLNLTNSSKDNPDENYARELQELFTLGKGPNSKYTEQDIVAASKVLVGWSFSASSRGTQGPITVYFDPNNHNLENKQFSPFYDNRAIKGRAGKEGIEELNELLDMIFATEECALYICRRLYQFFVYPHINEIVEKKIIQPLALVLRDNNYEILVPLRVLVRSKHFFDTSFYSALIKSPLEFMFGFFKEFNFEYKNYESMGDIPNKYTNSETRNFYKYRPLHWTMDSIGLNYMEPPTVAGWPAYYQNPVYDLFWINSITVERRAELGNQLARWGLNLGPGDSGGWVQLVIDRVKYITSLENPMDLDSVLDQVTDRLLAAPISQATRTRIKNTILEGQSEEHYSELVNTYLADPSEENKAILSNRLEHLFAAIFQLGEFQLF